MTDPLILLNDDPAFKAYRLRENSSVVIGDKYEEELCPIQCIIIPHGTLDDKPSLVFVLESQNGKYYYAQISVKMLSPVIEAVGYKKDA